MKTARLIYNPVSGKGEIRRNVPYILDRLKDTGYDASDYATTAVSDATDAARRAADREYDLVVIAGGDGTIHEAVNGLAEQPHRPTLGIIPTGTTNDLARGIGVPQSIEKACDTLGEGTAIPIDIGKANDRYFIYFAGGGKLTEISYDVSSKLKNKVGRLAYYLKGAQVLPKVRPTKVRIEYDGERFEDDIMMLFIANTTSVSGFEKFAPDASLNDGLFNMIILKKTNFVGIANALQKAMRGVLIDDPRIIHKTVKHVKVHPETEMKINLDGEFGGLFPCEISNLYQHLQIIVPEETSKKFS